MTHASQPNGEVRSSEPAHVASPLTTAEISGAGFRQELKQSWDPAASELRHVIMGAELDRYVPLCSVFKKGAERDPCGIGLAGPESSYTWRELDTLSDRLAANYLSLGIKPGDRFASFMPNSPELFMHYIACFKAGIISVPLNIRYREHEIGQGLRASGASSILLSTTLNAHIKRFVQDQFALKILTDRSTRDGNASLQTLLAFDLGRPRIFQDQPRETPCAIFFTSGTTGDPKGVTHTYGSLASILSSIVRGVHISSHDVVFPAANFSTYLFSLGCLSEGAKVVLSRNLEPADLVPLLRQHQPSIFGMLPAGLYNLITSPLIRPDDFKSLRMCLSGGDKVPDHLSRRFKELTALDIVESYGMTEMGGSHNNPSDGGNVPGSVGVTMPGFVCSIRDAVGNEVERGQEGELWVRGPCVMKGYWNNPIATSQTLKDGWLRTGDLMVADSDGFFWFRGRIRQIIVRGGSNICPQEVEEVLLQHPGLEKAAIVGVPHPVYGATVVAFVTRKQSSDEVSSQDLRKFCENLLSAYKIPEKFAFLPDLPMNDGGKIDRAALQRLAELVASGEDGEMR